MDISDVWSYSLHEFHGYQSNVGVGAKVGWMNITSLFWPFLTNNTTFNLRIWNVSENEKRHSYYVDFLNTVSRTNYNNLVNFKHFAFDESVQHVDMREIIRFIRFNYINEVEKLGLGTMFTEMGLCRTSSFIRWYGHHGKGAYDKFVLKKFKSERRYGYLDKMEATFSGFSLGQRQNATIVWCKIGYLPPLLKIKLKKIRINSNFSFFMPIMKWLAPKIQLT